MMNYYRIRDHFVEPVGKGSLSEDQKLNLGMAKLTREDFLQQKAFKDYDYRCPVEMTSKIMGNLNMFFILPLLRCDDFN